MSFTQQEATLQQNRTKEHLIHAFIELIKEKGYHAVTVKDIVDRAQYNRSTFYLHFKDKIELAESLLHAMLLGLENSVGKSYVQVQKVLTTQLNSPSFNILTFIYEHRQFFELIKYPDTLPGLHTQFPLAITNIYNEKFIFKTLNNTPVNMTYFKRYTSYGFYGLIMNWISTGFDTPLDEFIHEVIKLSKTHIHSFEFIGK